MINLFETFNNKSIILYKSFKYANINRQTIVLNEDGFLPNDVTSPYQYFSNNNKKGKPLFFNEIVIPKLWSIEGNNSSALIKDSNLIRGRIFYRKNFKNRIVERVEWLDKRGHTQFIDYYNKEGMKYAEQVMNPKNNQRVLKQYFNDRNEIFMTENQVTNDINLKWQGVEYHFHSKVEFIKFYLLQNGWETESFLINSYGFIAATINVLSESTNNIIYNQQVIDDNTISHLENLLSKPNNKYHALISGSNDFKKTIERINQQYIDRVHQSGYVYKFAESARQNNQVLILTNSDQVINLENIVNAHANLDFHIVALTEMSGVLTNLKKYQNVNLYPNVRIKKVKELLRECSIYLDINRGNEILDAVRAAFDYQLLILSYNDTSHNLNVTAPENVFNVNAPDDLSFVLQEIQSKAGVYEERMRFQLVQGAAIDKNDFIESIIL